MPNTPKKRRNARPLRYRVVRSDATVGATERRMEKCFGLPNGSVCLLLPSGRKARSDKEVGSLLGDWAE